MEESEEEIKSRLINVKEESEKAGLKLNTQKASWHPVPSIHGKQGNIGNSDTPYPGLQNQCSWLQHQ